MFQFPTAGVGSEFPEVLRELPDGESAGRRRQRHKIEMKNRLPKAVRAYLKGSSDKKAAKLEVEAWESILRQKHDYENGHSNAASVASVAEPVQAVEEVPRKSKAARRKERKKQALIADREEVARERARLAEEGNSASRERERIEERLHALCGEVVEVPPDGSCLFHSIALHSAEDAMELRHLVQQEMRANPSSFRPFCEVASDEEWEEFLNSLLSPSTWGGELEIAALAQALHMRICVIESTGVREFGEMGKKIYVCYHRNLYATGAHYNGVVLK